MNKHTPGYWEFYSNNGVIGVAASTRAGDIAICSGTDGRRSKEESEANARLCAAAPAMLEVMQRALRLSREYPEQFRLYAMAPFEAAIAAATNQKEENDNGL